MARTPPVKPHPSSAGNLAPGSADELAACLAAVAETAAEEGLSALRLVGNQVCGIKRFNFTTAVMVGLGPVSYGRRYCYEHEADARAALASWEEGEHPPGLWIKCKGAGIEILNPAFCAAP